MCNKKNYVLQNQKQNICTFSCSKWKISREKYENVFLLPAPTNNPIIRSPPHMPVFNFQEKRNFYQLCLIFLSTSCTEVSSEYWCQSALTSDEAINVENKPATRQTSLSRRRRIMRAATAAFSSRSNLTRWKLGQMKTFHKIDTSFLSCASRFELHAEISRREKRISSERMVQL